MGPIRFLSYSELEVVPQEKTGLKVLKERGPRSNNLGSVSHASSARGEILSCSERTCVLTFKTQEEAKAHMDTGKHVRAADLDCKSVYDAAPKKWADRVGEMHVTSGDRQRIAFDEAGPSSARECCNIGRALKSTKRTTRMEEKVKALLVQTFNQGVVGGQKADPILVAGEMKSSRDSSVKLQFKPDEWRTAQQISNIFARMSALQR